MAKSKVLSLLCAINFIFIASAYSDGVPAFMWTNTGFEFENPLAGHTTQADEFQRDYLEEITKKSGHVLITFVQDKLSLEDIIDNADVYNEHSTGAKFSNLKKLVETHTSVHLPSVRSAGDAVDRLASQFSGETFHLKEPFDLKGIKINSAASTIIICHLPHNNGRNFDKVDKIIGTVTSDLKSLGLSFTALYTGRSSSQVHEEESQYLGRHLLADDEPSKPEAQFFNTSCIWLYFEQMAFTITWGTKDALQRFKYQIPTNVTYEVKDNCNNATDSISFSVPASDLPKGLTKLNTKMTFKNSKGGYWVTAMAVNYTAENQTSYGKLDKSDVELDASAIFGPKKFSYHCSGGNGAKFTEVKKNQTKKAITYVSLSFKQIQVQHQNLEKNKFGYPNDCDGFFSITILSGLMAGIVLASILAFGICMIVNISTMDRFDDPKGKTISVNPTD